jgi:hypothetical protein
MEVSVKLVDVFSEIRSDHLLGTRPEIYPRPALSVPPRTVLFMLDPYSRLPVDKLVGSV